MNWNAIIDQCREMKIKKLSWDNILSPPPKLKSVLNTQMMLPCVKSHHQSIKPCMVKSGSHFLCRPATSEVFYMLDIESGILCMPSMCSTVSWDPAATPNEYLYMLSLILSSGRGLLRAWNGLGLIVKATLSLVPFSLWHTLFLQLHFLLYLNCNHLELVWFSAPPPRTREMESG